MRRVFADSMYWIALANPKDQWHVDACEIDLTLDGALIITTQEVLIEFLTHFCEHGASTCDNRSRRLFRAYWMTQRLRFGRNRRVPSTPGLLFITPVSKRIQPDRLHFDGDDARQEGLSEVLSHDDHFTQDGYICLL